MNLFQASLTEHNQIPDSIVIYSLVVKSGILIHGMENPQQILDQERIRILKQFRSRSHLVFKEVYSSIIHSVDTILKQAKTEAELSSIKKIVMAVLEVSISFGYPALDKWDEMVELYPTPFGIEEWIKLGIYMIDLIDQKNVFFDEFDSTLNYLLNPSNFTDVESKIDPSDLVGRCCVRINVFFSVYGISPVDKLESKVIDSMYSLNRIKCAHTIENLVSMTWATICRIPVASKDNWFDKKKIFINARQGRIKLGVHSATLHANSNACCDCSAEYAFLSNFRALLVRSTLPVDHPQRYISSKDSLSQQITFSYNGTN